MSDLTRTSIETNDLNRKATPEELANVPTMTQEEMTDVMKSPEYRNSKLAQELVAASIAKSNHAAPITEEPQQAPDDIAAKQATFAALFRDPRYKNDPAYRWEVAQKVKAFTANDNQDSKTGAPLTMADFKTPGQTMRVSVSASPAHGIDMSVRKFNRVEMPAEYTGLEMPKKKSPKEPFPGV
jgi:hypothetical protein